MTARTPSVTMTSVLGLLARQRSAATYAGTMLPTLQDRLALLEQDMLLELRLPGSASAYLLFQRGWIVYAQWQQTLGLSALEPINTLAPLAVVRAIPLASAAATLAFAAVGGSSIDVGVLGTSVQSDVQSGVQSDDAAGLGDPEAQLSRLRTWHFSGVLIRSAAGPADQEAVQEGSGQPSAAPQVLTVWHLVQGRLAAQTELIHAEPGHAELHQYAPFTPLLLAWDDHLLPRLNTPAELPPPLPEAALPVSALPQQPAAPDPAQVRPGGLPGDAEIWKLFQSMTQAQLGAAAARLVRLMQGKHGLEHGEQLQESLGRQIDRIANQKLGQQFRHQLSTPIPGPMTRQEFP